MIYIIFLMFDQNIFQNDFLYRYEEGIDLLV